MPKTDSTQTTTLFGRTVLIQTTGLALEVDQVVKYIEGLFQREAIEDRFGRINSGEVFLSFFNPEDALFVCDEHESNSIPSILRCTMAEMDSLDVDVDKLWLHGDHVTDSMIKQRIEQMIQEKGYHVTGVIQDREPRSIIICFDTKKLAALYDVLNTISVTYKCQFVRAHVRVRYNVNQLSKDEVLETIKCTVGDDELLDIQVDAHGMIFRLKTVECLQKLLEDKTCEVKKQHVTFELFYPCLTVEYYSNFQKQELENRSKGKILKASAGEIALLEKSKYLSDLKVQYADSVNIDWDKSKEEIYIYGASLYEWRANVELELVLKEKFSSCPVDELGLEPGECEVLATEGFDEMTNLYFNIKQIHACISRVNSQLVVHYDVASLTSAELKRVLCEYISRNEIELDPVLCAVFCSTSWRSFYTRRKQEESKLQYTAFGVDVPNNKMIIYGPTADTEKIKSHMTKYLDEQFLRESIFTMDYSIYKYMETFKPEKFQEVETICRQNGCRLERFENMFHFVGLEEGTILGLETITNLRRSIKVGMISFGLSCCSEFLKSAQGQRILEEVGRQKGCLLELRGGRRSHQPESALPSGCCYSGVMGAWHVYVVTCEPSRMQVDCFLNVMHVQRFKDDTPPFGFDDDCWKKLRTTDITNCRLILTGAGNKKDIPIIHIIHSGARKKLLNEMTPALQYAEKCSEHSIALSTSCTDEGLLQLVMINMQIIGSQSEFLKKPLDLYVCCGDLTQASSVANNLFLKAQPSLSSGRGLKRTEIEHILLEKLHISTNAINDDGDTPLSFKEITVFSTEINLIIGDIVLVDADAMVTSFQSKFGEPRGMVMREVVSRGGAHIEEQLKQKYPNGMKDWDFAVSGAGKLPHKYLFHVCLPYSYFKTAEDKITQLVFNLLEEAGNLHLQSISIPALGTRALNFNPRKVCASILKAVQLYTEEYKMSSVRKINLVVYNTQAEIYAAFHEAFSDFKSDRIGIMSSTTKTLAKDIIGNLMVNVLIDDVTNQNSDALLVTAHPSLDLTIGNLSRAVLSSAGQEIQDMLRQRYPQGIKYYEFATSISGGLGCGRIYYIALPVWEVVNIRKVKQLLVEVFKDMEKAGLASLSLPAIGTGGLEFPFAQSKNIITEAIKLFSQTNPNCLVNLDVILHTDDVIAQQCYAKGLLEDENTITSDVTRFNYNQLTVILKKLPLSQEQSDVIMVSVGEGEDIASQKTGQRSVWGKCSKEFVKKLQATYSDQNQTGFVQIKDPKWKLKCKELYILNTQVYKEAWQLGVYEVLKHAERAGFKSVSLSLIESGCTYEELHQRVKDLHSALKIFSSDVVQSLTKVRLVVECPHAYSAARCMFNDLSSRGVPPKCANVSVYYTDTAGRLEAETQLKDSLQAHYKESILFSQFVSSFNDANSYRLKEKGFRNMLDVNIEKNTLKVYGFGDVTVLQKEIQQIEIEDWKKCMVGKSIREKWESSIGRENVKLLPTSFESMCVEKYYKDNGARGTVIQIERIENKKLCDLYSSRKIMMDRKNLYHENEKLLFHGANAHSTCAISETGFSRNTCGNHDTRYGIGVYFSKSAEYAEKSALPSDTGILKIFLARVLVGYSVETTQGQLAIVQEPNSSRTYDSGKAPDSNEDGIVVIFTDSQAYPEYVITSKIHSSDTQTTAR